MKKLPASWEYKELKQNLDFQLWSDSQTKTALTKLNKNIILIQRKRALEYKCKILRKIELK